jgi:hypothetical protein
MFLGFRRKSVKISRLQPPLSSLEWAFTASQSSRSKRCRLYQHKFINFDAALRGPLFWKLTVYT